MITEMLTQNDGNTYLKKKPKVISGQILFYFPNTLYSILPLDFI